MLNPTQVGTQQCVIRYPELRTQNRDRLEWIAKLQL